jgi:[acyl-carrier-protein] S-malonyltransferase
MGPPARAFAADLAGVALRAPGFPVVANASATPVTTSDEARRLLAEQLTSPVRWSEGIRKLSEIAGPGVRFVEVGPGTVLTGLARRILGAVETQNLGTAAEVAAFLEA